jgi:transposase InsO family protein
MSIFIQILACCARIILTLASLARNLSNSFHNGLFKRKSIHLPIKRPSYCRAQAKPAWVKQEVIRLKALLPQTGCRKIAGLFNRLHCAKRKMTVSKSYVADTIRQHRYQIQVLRRMIKHRTPKTIPRNHLWALDFSGKGDVFGKIHSILGIIDHGSRKLLTLDVVRNKNAWALLGYLFLAIGKFGKPRSIRSDNESIFKERAFRLILFLAGIRQQFTEPGCPWMNGRIERLFGTLKQNLDQLKIDGRETLTVLLTEFSHWYNAVRPHQHLNDLTPDEVWYGIDPYVQKPKSAQLFNGWDGRLQGYRLRF